MLSSRALLFCAIVALLPQVAVGHPQREDIINELRSDLKKNPSPESCESLVEILYERDECSSAITQSEECLRLFPKSVVILRAKAKALACVLRWDEASRVIDQLEAQSGSSFETIHMKLAIAEKRGDPATALQAAQEILKREPMSEPHLYLKGASLMKRAYPQKISERLSILHKGIDAHPYSLALWLEVLREQETGSQFCDAQKTAQQLRAKFPNLNKETWDAREANLARACPKPKDSGSSRDTRQ